MSRPDTPGGVWAAIADAVGRLDGERSGREARPEERGFGGRCLGDKTNHRDEQDRGRDR